ncbi:XRE family transcriptional regulator [Candidatus Parcubacteria bacterium]|nr:XRE family transcriptional regulator [Candidatus Parcubacteria bacterium]
MELNEFLVKAKKNTYASNGEGGENKLEDGSKELTFEEGDFKYRDRYFGNKAFIGEEIIWKDGEAVWGMNYYGRMLSESMDMGKLYGFLKKALLEVHESMPFRGPKELQDGDFIYSNSVADTKDSFRGEEVIFYKDEKIYELKYHGGLIKK